MMLEFKKLRLRNYLSYGDCDTVIELDSMGACLITGELDKYDSPGDGKDSNGAGKSTLVEAILWCLFGRTTRVANPGDKVINHFTQKDCSVEIEFKNGDTLRRTRNVDGHNDLLLIQAGEDKSLGTNRMEQRRLNNLLKLDWDIFCGSSFFSQFGKSWMEIGDIKRKEALEREFHMDRIQFYSDAAKLRLDASKSEQDRVLLLLNGKSAYVKDLNQQMGKFLEASKQFEVRNKARIGKIKLEIKELKSEHDSISMVDINAIKQAWDNYNNKMRAVMELRLDLEKLQRDKRAIETDIDIQNNLIKKWKHKGDVCSACEQPISKQHIDSKITTPHNEIMRLSKVLQSNQSDIDKLLSKIRSDEIEANKSKPSQAIENAEFNNNRQDMLKKQIKSRLNDIDNISKEHNHYDSTISGMSDKIKMLKDEIAEIKLKVSKLDKLINHLNYIYRAYHDRRKIKSYMLSEYIPYLNKRISYYSQKFGLDLKVEFTNALGIKSDKWGYELFSGGECKRFDVAMMLAMFDLHTLMYGRHCNILVFDEVDGRLDVRGAEIFSDIILSDFAPKVDSIFIISQRLDMRGAMPSEIIVKREDRISRIAEVRK